MIKQGKIKIVVNDDYPFENSYNRVTYWYNILEVEENGVILTYYECYRSLIERGNDGINYEIDSDTLNEDGVCQVILNKHFDSVKEFLFENVESFEWIEPLA